MLTSFPLTLSVQVIFVTQTSSKQDLKALFKKARAFQINGKNVALWALFLSAQRKLERPPSDVLARLDAMTEVPDTLVEATLTARTTDEAGLMARALVGKRRGYANTHEEPSAQTMAEQGSIHANALDDGERGREHRILP
jgi:hypothetical protein